MKNRNTLKRVWHYIDKKKMVLCLILAIPSSLCMLIIPVLSGSAVDMIVSGDSNNYRLFFEALCQIGIMAIVSAGTRLAMEIENRKLSYQTAGKLRKEAFEHIQNLPLSILDKKQNGDLSARIVADTDQLSEGLLLGFTQLFSSIITAAGTVYFMIRMNLITSLIVIVLTPLSIIVAKTIASSTHKLVKAQAETRGEQAAFIDEMVRGQKTIRSFGAEREIQKQFDEINDKLAEQSRKAVFASSLTNPATRFVNSIVYACVAVAGAFLSISGTISLGTLTACLSYANQYTKPFNEISGIITELQNAFVCADRVFALKDEKAVFDDSDNEIGAVAGNVDVKNVSFSYDADASLIENFSLNVRSGEHVAIVGPTGSGKTTLINLLMRFYDPNKGKILLDGKNTVQYTRHSVRASYGMVLQETWIRKGTVLQNILLSCDTSEKEKAVRAAKSAGVHDMIMRLPKGYDTMLGTEGDVLSEGEKQLICIARVLVHKPSIMILDEATSNIDTRTELLVQRAFDRAMENRTSFVVAHRLSTVQNADRIIVMEHGNIVETGVHRELLQKGGLYSEMYSAFV